LYTLYCGVTAQYTAKSMNAENTNTMHSIHACYRNSISGVLSQVSSLRDGYELKVKA